MSNASHDFDSHSCDDAKWPKRSLISKLRSRAKEFIWAVMVGVLLRFPSFSFKNK